MLSALCRKLKDKNFEILHSSLSCLFTYTFSMQTCSQISTQFTIQNFNFVSFCSFRFRWPFHRPIQPSLKSTEISRLSVSQTWNSLGSYISATAKVEEMKRLFHWISISIMTFRCIMKWQYFFTMCMKKYRSSNFWLNFCLFKSHPTNAKPTKENERFSCLMCQSLFRSRSSILNTKSMFSVVRTSGSRMRPNQNSETSFYDEFVDPIDVRIFLYNSIDVRLHDTWTINRHDDRARENEILNWQEHFRLL